MNRPNHEDRKFFFGKEVEHTPAFGQDTLFVVGFQTPADIEKMLSKTTYDTKHIYFGANQSFDPHSSEDWQIWETMIRAFLDCGFWCTLDFDVRHTELVAETSLVEYNTFIPMISVKIPYVRLMNYNAVVKIDDRDFAATNPGVWCHSLHDLQRRDKFTDWSQYSSDEVLE